MHIITNFESFLLNNCNASNWEFLDLKEQVNQKFIKLNYISKEDFKCCLNYDINKLSENKDFKEIKLFFHLIKKEFDAEILDLN
jgi:hypothetical protein